MKLDLFIQSNNFDTQRPQQPTPQVYLDKMLYLFDKYALKSETMTDEQWKILNEIVENKKIIQKALLPLKGICNYELSIVGGSLRDIIAAQPEKVNDYDMVISCGHGKAEDILNLARNMGFAIDLQDEELNKIKTFRIESAKEQRNAKDNEWDNYTEKYLIEQIEKDFYFSKVINKLMSHTKNYKHFSANNVKEKYMNFHITSINQFTGFNDKKVDLIVSDYYGLGFLSTFDFELCKIYADLKKVETKEDLLGQIIPTGSMLRDIDDKTFSVKVTKFSPENLHYFFNKHLLKLIEKYPEYKLNIFSDKKIEDFTLGEKERWICAQHLQMNMNFPEKGLVHKKLKI